MTRFIVVSFLIMGWAYYEFSGGSDFVPETRPEAVVAEARLSTSSEPEVIAEEPVEIPVAEVVADLTTTAADPVLTPEEDVANAVAVALSQPEEGEVLTPDTETVASVEPVEVTPDAEATEDELTFVSLSQSPDGQATPTPALADDLRIVDASRLNVRLGPSTGDGVVGQLIRGEVVTLVSTNGDGWALVRIEGDGVEGWVAERFLTR